MDYIKNWDECLKYIEGSISEQAFQTWFTGVTVSSIDENTITLQVPNQFHFEWLESKYRNLIDDAVEKKFGKSHGNNLKFYNKLMFYFFYFFYYLKHFLDFLLFLFFHNFFL